MALLTKEQILGARRPTDEIDLPNLGGALRLRGLTVADHRAMLKKAAGDTDTLTDLLMAGCVVGPDDAPLFSEDEAADLARSISVGDLQAIIAAINKLNGLEPAKN